MRFVPETAEVRSQLASLLVLGSAFGAHKFFLNLSEWVSLSVWLFFSRSLSLVFQSLRQSPSLFIAQFAGVSLSLSLRHSLSVVCFLSCSRSRRRFLCLCLSLALRLPLSLEVCLVLVFFEQRKFVVFFHFHMRLDVQ